MQSASSLTRVTCNADVFVRACAREAAITGVITGSAVGAWKAGAGCERMTSLRTHTLAWLDKLIETDVHMSIYFIS